MPKSLRPNLYRTIKIVMSDGATFRVPSAVRTVGNTLQLDRDPANHPAYLGTTDQSGMLGRREEQRLERVRTKTKQDLFD
ncbi:ribosomal protein l31 [Chrysochromulina tobinii]|uniref:Large ribosomal subunit protein bL31c n=1 Tax=Chrysochromulina tobinii TaxID=1460289 RepID=A0A0M0KAD1_9EUKA|nr:ribosomal protein l31 [Chrysochromulina tobinii]|eukprot:KOO35537.1 ribosomal protein l31 [Chrysochromulina sp. CCMP291]